MAKMKIIRQVDLKWFSRAPRGRVLNRFGLKWGTDFTG